eukprot:CAMPEP_0118968134 /NCGR_PEP_ID=MMETSP1173-20130426/5415_1 /TAXON_ID=1034831 /ORGANISM="Rhizochromulina marina cf, Strain CCMP1243" /LENGTH=73 /DNA_ID=CAMNT_0006917201 /DNA_START=90 /DNA_END=307 /DNA_ORIENTATION=+
MLQRSDDAAEGLRDINNKQGSQVLFKQVVQLRHVRSKKLLSIDIHTKSTTGTLSMEVVLQDESSQSEVHAQSG